MLNLTDKSGNKVIEIYDDDYEKYIDDIAANLRKEDHDEVIASTGDNPCHAIKKGCELSSRLWLMFDKAGEAVAILGVRPLEVYSNIGIPWFLGTNGLDNMKRFFVSISKPIIEQMMDGFNVLVNYVDARYKKTVRWLEWCGFVVDEPEPFGALKLPFHRFYMRTDNG